LRLAQEEEHMQRIYGVVLLACMLLAAGCASASATSRTSHPMPDRVQVTRAWLINRFPPLDQSIADPSATRRLYQAVTSLPPYHAQISCPKDVGLEYILDFSRAGTPVAKVLVYASGCAYVQIPTEASKRAPTDAFWTLLAQTLDVSTSDLFPRPDPSQ
jgi:hypothetical protein